MPPAPRVLAVCVNWNGGEMLARTVASLRASKYPNLGRLVVDNASSDGSQALVSPPVELLQLPENLGYGGALNRAFQRYGSGAEDRPDYFLILNNDIEFGPDLVSRMVEFARRHGPGVIGPQVRSSQDPSRLDAAWGEMMWHHVLARYYGWGAPAQEPPWNRPREVELLLGCALLVDREVIERAGPWDENFFMYHEEVDFLYRVRRLGYPIYYCPFSWVLHESAYSTRREPLLKTYWLRRNTVYFFRKHGAGWADWTRYAATLLASLAYNLFTLRWRRLAAILRGVRDGWLGKVRRA